MAKMKFKLYGTKKIPKKKAATFGYQLFETRKLEEVVVYANTHAIIPSSVKNNHRLRNNVQEIFNWIRLDVDVKGEAKKIDKALKNVFYIKKPSTSHKKNPYKWHYLIPIENVSQNYDAYKLQYYKFLSEFKIKLSDKSLASVVQNTNPMGEEGVALTYVNKKGEVWTAPTMKVPERKKLKEKHSDMSEAKIVKLLDGADPDCSYEEWFRIGMAVYDWCPKRGFKLFDEWSKGSDKYDGTTADKWTDFQNNASGDVTIGTLIHMVHGEKQEPMDVFGKEEKGSVYNVSKKEKKKIVKKIKKEKQKDASTVKVDKGDYNRQGFNESVIDKIKGEVMRVRGGYELLNKNGKWIFVTDREFWSVVPHTFGSPFNLNAIDDMKTKLAKFSETKETKKGGIENVIPSTKKTVKQSTQLEVSIEMMEEEFALMRKQIINHIVAYNQYETRKMEVDPFKNKDEVIMIGDTVSVTLCNIFYNVNIKKPKWNTKPYLEDFKKHFSHFDELGLLVEMEMGEMKKAVRGEPSGVDPKGFITAWILQFDEVKYIPAELKKIYNEITIAAKGKQRMEVPTYMKWLSSAEDIAGMKGVGADDQFANRMSAWDMGTKKLTSRKLYKKGGARYFISLKWEIYRIIEKAVKKHVKMGKQKAYIKSEKYIDAFHDKYGIEAGLNTTVEEFKGELLSHVTEIATNRTRDTWVGIDKIIAKDFKMLNGELIALRVGKFNNIFTTLSKEYYGDDSKALLYKSGIFRDMFVEDRVKYKNTWIYPLKI